MKKLSIIILMLFSVSLFAKTYYVSSVKANVYKEKDNKTVVKVLDRNNKIDVISQEGSWFKIKDGYIKKMFVRETKCNGKFSILGNASENARTHARIRASSSVTAASSRGLQKDNPRGRELDNINVNFDPRVLEEIESLYIPEEQLIEFLKELK